MKMQSGAVEREKVLAIGFLYAVSAAIALMGLALCVYSAVTGMTFSALGASVPGAAFGAVIAFLGIRYFLAVQKLRREVYKSTSRFSWANFRKR